MSNHTPGPWYVGNEDPDTNEIEVCSDARPYICLVLPGAVGKWSEANARLIAAAPELLDALIRLEAELVEDKYSEEYEPSPFENLAVARAAIAKATGE